MQGSSGSGSAGVEAYLARVPPAYRAALEEVRATVKEVAPDAEEVICYAMPAFRHHGNLVYYAAFRDHCSLFIGSVTTQRRFAAELKEFETGKGTVHFTPDHSLPRDLVRRIVKARVAENEARDAAKRSRTASRPERSRGKGSSRGKA